ncbi:MAG: molybdopterin-dependent oxidoreductase [Candidatus Tectomicrobia bacterium]|uniref:Molybdopterin-dependent oxidoreductase n=1 Tax=Tectimicrobiota bacterium TaxID=2528274 RepID=A0A932GSD2_UNCTE|nr:molybdopterin-dependent oxidoreductase [Candidatus Tectomicrobia bacterium]
MRERSGDGGMKPSRREFLKLGGLAVGSLSLATGPEGVFEIPIKEKLEPPHFDREVNGICPYCQTRCTTKVQLKGDRVVNVYGNQDNFWTGGSVCPKGQAMVELTYSPHRLLHPLIRDGQSWKRISYSQALDAVAAKITRIKQEHPEDYSHRLALFAPLWDCHEAELAAQMTLHMAGFPDICSPGDACIGNLSTALNMCLGEPTAPTTINELENAELVVLVGANVAVTYPIYVQWLRRAREKGARILYFDFRATPTTNQVDEQVILRPGTDGALFLGMIRVLIQENLYDRKFVKDHVNGFDELARSCREYTPEKVGEITWVPPETIVGMARMLAKSKGTIIWIGGAISRYTNAMQTVRAIVGLQAITGQLAGPGKGIIPFQGGKPPISKEFEEKLRAPDLPERLHVRKVVYNMNQGDVDLLLLSSSFRRYPDSNRVKKAIQKVRFVVYRGFFMDEEADLSHLIIPSTMGFESAGSMYGLQRQIVWREQAVESCGETVPDWRFYTDLGKRLLGESYPKIAQVDDIYELHRSYTPTWKGLTIERLKKNPTGISWPCPSEDHPGTLGTLYRDNRFHTPHGKVELLSKVLGPIRWTEPKGSPLENPNEEQKQRNNFPLIFTQGKVAHHWQHMTNWSDYMAQFSEGNVVQLNPATAREYGIQNGDWVHIETQVGKIKARVRLTEGILPGVVWTPSHLGSKSPFAGNRGENTNEITPNYWDKVAAQFNGFGCRLRKA